MPKVLVIAGTSFVGRHVCEHLCAIGCSVVATSRSEASLTGCEMAFCDLADAASVERIVRNCTPDWIIQCAAATSSSDPRELYRTHVDGTLSVLDAAHRFAPDAAICLFGSAAEYGLVNEDRFPIREDCPCQPATFFGASKLAQTLMAQAAVATRGQKIIIVRPFNVIGPGLPDFYFAASLARRLLKLQSENAPPGTRFEIFNATSTRDFIDVRVVANAVTTLLCRLNSPDTKEAGPGESLSGSIFNLATGIETPLFDVARVLGELAGGYVPEAAGETQSRGGIVRSVGDASKLRRVVGRTPLSNDSPECSERTPADSWEASIRDLWESLQPRQSG